MTPRLHPSSALLAAALALVSITAACGDEGAEPATTAANSEGPNGKTDSGGSAAFEGRNDPVANFLRKTVSAQGTLTGDYRTVLDGVAAEMGCAPSSERTFVILLSRKSHFPRNIVTLCSDDPVKASQFFLSTQSDDGALSDIEPRDIKMIGWDEPARTYRTYEMKPYEGDDGAAAMRVEVEPAHCRSCHTGPVGMDSASIPFTPIMNELVNPWTLWNAEPEFRSHLFDDVIDPALEDAPVYGAMTQGERLDSAANFERHTREALARVTNARTYIRRDPANLDASLALLRPMFCDETLNYVSENHFNGELHASAILDDSTRRLYLAVRPDNWPWDWLNDGKLRLPAPTGDQTPIAVLPTRGEASLQVENALVSRRTLTPMQILQIRALDWKRPALSTFRCDLYNDGVARLRQNPPDLSAYARNQDLLPVLLDAILHVEIEGQLVPLKGSTSNTLIAIPDAEAPDAYDALATGDLAAWETDLDGLGAQLDDWFNEVEADGSRAWLQQERARRGCTALASYPASPEIPGIDCP